MTHPGPAPSAVASPRIYPGYQKWHTSTILQMRPSLSFVSVKASLTAAIPAPSVVRVGLTPCVKYAIKCLPDALLLGVFCKAVQILPFKHNVHLLVFYTAKLDFFANGKVFCFYTE